MFFFHMGVASEQVLDDIRLFLFVYFLSAPKAERALSITSRPRLI